MEKETFQQEEDDDDYMKREVLLENQRLLIASRLLEPNLFVFLSTLKHPSFLPFLFRFVLGESLALFYDLVEKVSSVDGTKKKLNLL